MLQLIKTEHNGAKNGGGYYGTRDEAKKISKKLRRRVSKLLTSQILKKI